MEEQVWISHIQGIALVDNWITITDLLGRQYRLDPQAALEWAVWVAKHHQDVAEAQLSLQAERRMEEARLYGPLLEGARLRPTESPLTSPAHTSPPKRRRRSPRKKEEAEGE